MEEPTGSRPVAENNRNIIRIIIDIVCALRSFIRQKAKLDQGLQMEIVVLYNGLTGAFRII